MIHAGWPSVSGLELEDCHVPTLWPLLYSSSSPVSKLSQGPAMVPLWENLPDAFVQSL